MSTQHDEETYGLSKQTATEAMDAPDLPYRPREPKSFRPTIGLIGCGGITEQHLEAYKRAGYEVVALCDVLEEAARKRAEEFYPEALVTTDHRAILNRADIDVVDIATHPAERVSLVTEALRAGKHVLSQKPFVLDLDVGEQLVQLADDQGLKLAVNQNGRWAPHFSYMREAVQAGLIGEPATVDISIHWDHNWVADTVFNDIHHLILYDFAIHWFDITCAFFGDRAATSVYAAVNHADGQTANPPLLAHAVVEFENGQATLNFNANCPLGQEDRTTVIGSRGTIRSVGPSLMDQTVTLWTPDGYAAPDLEGAWFPDGFHGHS